MFHFLTILEVKPQIMFYYNSSNYDSEYDNDNSGVSDNDNDENDLGWRGEFSEDEAYLTDSIRLSDDTGLWECCSASLKAFAKKHRVIWARSPRLSEQTLSVAGNYGNEASLVRYKGNICIFCKW